MKLNERERKLLQGLARGSKGTFLIEYLEKVKSYVSDVRNELAGEATPEVEKAVRIGVCQILDDLVINKFKALSLDNEASGNEDYD